MNEHADSLPSHCLHGVIFICNEAFNRYLVARPTADRATAVVVSIRSSILCVRGAPAQFV